MIIKKIPMVRRYVVKSLAYDITFSIEKVIEMGTTKTATATPMETDQAE
jgi:hypothetical protein